MSDAERKLLEMTVAALISLQGLVAFNPHALENLLNALKQYQQEREHG